MNTGYGMFKILSLDGGGIRGVIGASFLRYYEDRGYGLAKSFDMVVGTSTGGILALGVGFGKRMENMVNLYQVHGKEIFPPSWLNKCGWIGRKVRQGRNIFTAHYSMEPLLKLLQREFGATTRFCNPDCRLRIPSYNLQLGQSKIFRASVSEAHPDDSDYLVWQVAAATSAAPTYFPSFTIANRGIFVDGGLWANDPTLVAILEAVRLGYALEQIRVLSLGTGSVVFRRRKRKSGLYSWGSDLVEATFQAQTHGTQDLIKHQVEVDRPDFKLREQEAKLDSIAEVDTLVLAGRNAAEQAEREKTPLSAKYFVK